MNKFMVVLCSLLLVVACSPQEKRDGVSFVPISNIGVDNESNETDGDTLDDDITIEDLLSDLNASNATDEEVQAEEDSGVVAKNETMSILPDEEDADEPVIGDDEPASDGEDTVSGNESDVIAPRGIVIIVKETELVSLSPIASDPDEDTLVYTYSSPLSQNGTWQTTYGDAGEYTVTITVSDGELTTSRDALLIVNKREELPSLKIIRPLNKSVIMKETESMEFTVEASDLNNDTLDYVWKFDGEETSERTSYKLATDYESAGPHTVKVDVSDGRNIVSYLWSVTVQNVNRKPILRVIPDITVKESEAVRLSLQATDQDGDNITYTISEPIGNSGAWQTGYDSAGTYTINVSASDGDLTDNRQLKVTVINVNRPPVIDDIVQVS